MKKFQLFLSNTINFQIGIFLQMFLSNANNLKAIIWFQVFLSNTNNFQTDYLNSRWNAYRYCPLGPVCTWV